jgi:hypothetical protein
MVGQILVMGATMRQSKALVDGGSKGLEAGELPRQRPQPDTFSTNHGRESHIEPTE